MTIRYPSPAVVGKASVAVLSLGILSLFWGVVCLPPAVVLLFCAVTWDGRICAMAALLGGLFPAALVLAIETRRVRWWRCARWVFFGFVMALGWAVWRAPAGGAGGNARVRHVYSGSEFRFRRYSLGNLVPEGDQLALGFFVMPVFDRLFSHRQSDKLRRLSAEIYQELERDEEFHALGSAMPEVYDELSGGDAAVGHSYVCIPRGLDRSRAQPVLVFFHGSGGNFKAYLWLLSRLADRLGIVVVAPSFGFGNWRQTQTEAAYDAAMVSVGRLVKIAPESVHLIGLSNGGLAVSQLAAARRASFRSCSFVSPVFDDAALEGKDDGGVLRWDGADVSIISGTDDDRVPVRYLKTAAARLTASGARVAFRAVDAADHFLLFSHSGEVMSELESWLRVHGVAPP